MNTVLEETPPSNYEKLNKRRGVQSNKFEKWKHLISSIFKRAPLYDILIRFGYNLLDQVLSASPSKKEFIIGTIPYLSADT